MTTLFRFNENLENDSLPLVYAEHGFLNSSEIDLLRSYVKKTKHYELKATTTFSSFNDNLNFNSSISYDSKDEKMDEFDYRRKGIVNFINPHYNDEILNLHKNIVSKIIKINETVFGYNLLNIEPLQYTIYNIDNFYKKHIDITLFSSHNYFRKLSFSVQLTDQSEYEGGELLLHTGSEPIVAIKEIGSITLFPSYTLHEVTPVTKGKRESLVGWIGGPKFV